MKHLLSGVAVVAALAIATPVWAQNPSGGNSMGTPGPNPGGPGMTPYSGGAPAAAPSAMPAAPEASAPSGRMPGGGKKVSSGTHIPSSASNSAMPPMHRHAMHRPMRGHMAHGPTSTTDTTAQLNRQELARLQSVSAPPPMAAPPGPPGPNPSGGNSMGMPGPNTGGPGLTPYSSGTPQR
jgi:hypothetical protein